MTKTQFVAKKLGIDLKPIKITEWLVGYGRDGFPIYTTIDPEDGTEPIVRYWCQRSPDFTSDTGAVQLLRLMMKHRKWIAFVWSLGYEKNLTIEELIHRFCNDYITTPGALFDAVAEWFGWEDGK